MRTSSIRVNGEIVTLQEWRDQARVSVGCVSVYGKEAREAMESAAPLLVDRPSVHANDSHAA